jgi:5S rRNA maturation endonuclease (ribonuclease M5)
VAPPNDLLGLAITEGIEDAASAHQLTGLGAWAAGCASRLPRLAEVVPHYIEVVTIIVDPDKDGVRYSRQFAQELRARGFYVELFQQEFAEELAA